MICASNFCRGVARMHAALSHILSNMVTSKQLNWPMPVVARKARPPNWRSSGKHDLLACRANKLRGPRFTALSPAISQSLQGGEGFWNSFGVPQFSRMARPTDLHWCILGPTPCWIRLLMKRASQVLRDGNAERPRCPARSTPRRRSLKIMKPERSPSKDRYDPGALPQEHHEKGLLRACCKARLYFWATRVTVRLTP